MDLGPPTPPSIPPPTPPPGTPAGTPAIPPAVPPPLPTSTNDAPPTSPSQIPPGTPCPRCGYDLAGLSPSGLCPECGGANLNALEPYRFANASPSFVKRLHLGAMLTQIWATILVAYIVGMAVLVQSSGFAFRSQVLAVMSSVYWILPLLGFIGWWLVSSPDPNRLSLAKRDRRRRVFRTLLVVSVVLSVASFAFLRVFPLFSGMGVTLIIYTLSNFAQSAALIASVVYVCSFARRLPSEAFARRSRIILWICAVAVPTVYILYAAMVVAASGNSFGWLYMHDALWLMWLIARLALYLPYIALFHLTRKELKGVLARM